MVVAVFALVVRGEVDDQGALFLFRREGGWTGPMRLEVLSLLFSVGQRSDLRLGGPGRRWVERGQEDMRPGGETLDGGLFFQGGGTGRPIEDEIILEAASGESLFQQVLDVSVVGFLLEIKSLTILQNDLELG